MQCIDDYVLQKIHIIFKSRMRHAFRKKRRSPVEIPNAIRELLCDYRVCTGYRTISVR